MPSKEIFDTWIWSAERLLILAPTLSMKPEKNVLIVPLVATKSTVVIRLAFSVPIDAFIASMESVVTLDVLTFTGLNVVVVRFIMLALVALKLSQLTLFADTDVVVKVKLLFGGQPAILVWNDIYYMVIF